MLYSDMFRTSKCSSSGGVLYKHLPIFYRASYEASSRRYDTNDTIRSDKDIIQKCASCWTFTRKCIMMHGAENKKKTHIYTALT